MMTMTRAEKIAKVRFAISALLTAEQGANAEGYTTVADDMSRAREGLLEVAEQL